MISRINSELKMQRDVEGLNEQAVEHKLKPAIIPFAGRIGGNQDYVVDRSNPCNAELLAKVPDAAPLRTFRDSFDFRGFLDSGVWKYALVECIGTNDSPRLSPSLIIE